MRVLALTTLLAMLGNAASVRYTKRASASTASIQLPWANCTTNNLQNLECAQIQVPIDWSQPQGKQITLGISRVKATGSSASRVGSLIFNPGGPGGIATEFCEYEAAGIPIFSKAIREHLDIVCPDPRGNEAEFEEMVKHNRAFGQSCLDLSGDLFKHVDTTSVAKDMEAIRAALNDGKLNWLGGSYGTQIGAQYAELYPNNIRAMVLDGDVGDSPSEVYLHTTESSTYENSLDRFFDWCSKKQTCALCGQNVAQLFDDLVAKGDKTPISAPGCLLTADTSSAGTCFPNVTGEDIRFNVQGNSYLTYKYGTSFSPGRWLKLGIALNDTLNGNATALSSAMAMKGRIRRFGKSKYKQQLGSAIAPHTKGASQMYQYQTQCIGWPAPVVNPPHVLNQTAMKLVPPILMVVIGK